MPGFSELPPQKPLLKKRERLEKLVVATPEFPERLPKRILSIAKRFAPYEDLAMEAKSDEDHRGLTDIMEIDGVLTAEAVQDIESGGRMLRAFTAGLERTVLDGSIQSVERLNRLVHRSDKNFNDIMHRFGTDRRPLAQKFCAEMIRYSFFSCMAEQSAVQGIDAAITTIQTGRTPEHQKMLFDTIVAASVFRAEGPTALRERPHEETFELLRDSDFVPTSETGV